MAYREAEHLALTELGARAALALVEACWASVDDELGAIAAAA